MSSEKRIGLRIFNKHRQKSPSKSSVSNSAAGSSAKDVTKSEPQSSSTDDKSRNSTKSGNGSCLFCGRKDVMKTEEDESKLGELRHDPESGITIHTMCMYFAAGIKQDGDEDGILCGFFPEVLLKEKRRGQLLKCVFCKKSGATVGCYNGRCRVQFHFPCGLENGTFHEYFGEFRSFCKKHIPELPIEKKAREEASKRKRGVFYGSAMVQCGCCLETLPARQKGVALWTTCCVNASFHFKCVQKLATKVGDYKISCPLCRDQSQFKDDILANGIHLPIKDTDWEPSEENDELLVRPNKCDASRCFCPNGQTYNSANRVGNDKMWSIIICNTCGSTACHPYCSIKLDFGEFKVSESDSEEEWNCGDCVAIQEAAPKRKKARRSKK